MAEQENFRGEPAIARLLQNSMAVSQAVRQTMLLSREERAELARLAEAERKEQRRKSAPLAVTVERLTEKLGWSDAYAEHFVQPYCTCEDTPDGWDYCAHAVDEGVRPY